jgi:hypothetical protein
MPPLLLSFEENLSAYRSDRSKKTCGATREIFLRKVILVYRTPILDEQIALFKTRKKRTNDFKRFYHF